MTSVRILYGCQNSGMLDIAEISARRVQRQHGIEIQLDRVDGYDLFRELAADPNYNFVIFHLGSNKEGVYSQVDSCGRLTNAVLVAESTIYPVDSSEVLQHFDEYIGGPISKDKLTDLLKKYAFINDGE